MRFYAFGITPNHDNLMSRKHAAAGADKQKRAEIARRMFTRRFPGVDVHAYSVSELRGMEGLRVRAKYGELGQQYGVTWKGRNYDKSDWNLAHNINRALSAANASLYALCAAVECARSATCRRWDSFTTAARCPSSTMWLTSTRKSPVFRRRFRPCVKTPTTRENWLAPCSKSALNRNGCCREFPKTWRNFWHDGHCRP